MAKRQPAHRCGPCDDWRRKIAHAPVPHCILRYQCETTRFKTEGKMTTDPFFKNKKKYDFSIFVVASCLNRWLVNDNGPEHSDTDRNIASHFGHWHRQTNSTFEKVSPSVSVPEFFAFTARAFTISRNRCEWATGR